MLNLKQLRNQIGQKKDYNPSKRKAKTLGSKTPNIQAWGEPVKAVFQVWSNGVLNFQKGSSEVPIGESNPEGMVYVLGGYAGTVDEGDKLFTLYEGMECELIQNTTVRIPMTWASWQCLQQTMDAQEVNSLGFETEVPQHLDTTLAFETPYRRELEDGRRVNVIAPAFTVTIPKQDMVTLAEQGKVQPWSYQQALSIPTQRINDPSNPGVQYQIEAIKANNKRRVASKVYGRPNGVDPEPFYIKALEGQRGLGEPSLEDQTLTDEGEIPTSQESTEESVAY